MLLIFKSRRDDFNCGWKKQNVHFGLISEGSYFISVLYKHVYMWVCMCIMYYKSAASVPIFCLLKLFSSIFMQIYFCHWLSLENCLVINLYLFNKRSLMRKMWFFVFFFFYEQGHFSVLALLCFILGISKMLFILCPNFFIHFISESVHCVQVINSFQVL